MTEESLASIAGVAEITAVVSAAAAAATAVIAVVAIIMTTRDNRSRTRPVVMALFREAKDNDTAFELVIRNYGASKASDLDVRFDSPFGDSDGAERLTSAIRTRYEKRIPCLAPGGELTNLWWMGIAGGSDGVLVNKLETPDKVRVTVSYKGNRRCRYSDTYDLDSGPMLLTTSSISSTSLRGRLKTITEALSGIAIELRTLNSRSTPSGR